MHENPGSRSAQIASAVQLSVPTRHSSPTTHVTPSPVYPALHAHENEPGWFAQSAFASQLLSASSAHSLLSVHAVRPSPVNPR